MKLYSINPATEEKIGYVETSTEKDVSCVVSAAQYALKSWQNIPLKKRIEYIKRFIPLILQQKTNLAKLNTSEMGKPLKESMIEVEKTIELINYFCDNIHECFQTREFNPSQELKAIVEYVPYGVVGVIMPWNYPLYTPMWGIVPGLLTGNTVVFKPSEYTSLTGKGLASLFLKVLPKNVLHIIYGDGKVGNYLVKSPINMIAFVGSQTVGKVIMKNSSQHLHKLIFELGGKAPALVYKDCSLAYTAEGIAWGALRNCGQICNSIEKVYVEKGIEQQFIKTLLRMVKKIKVGKGMDKNTDVGPLANKAQLATVENHVKDAVKKGAKIIYGGKRLTNKGYFFQPTVLVNVREDMLVMKEETFGPVIPIRVVDNMTEAIDISNNSPFGLSATVWTTDLTKAHNVSKQLNVGTVAINVIIRTFPQVPWGGTKQSGFGRMLSIDGMREYVQSKVTYLSHSRFH